MDESDPMGVFTFTNARDGSQLVCMTLSVL